MNFSQYVKGNALVLFDTTINTSELVSFSRNNTYITELSLLHCNIDDKDVEVLVNGNLSHLNKLDLKSNKIGDQDAETLAKDNLSNLAKLDFQFNKIYIFS